MVLVLKVIINQFILDNAEQYVYANNKQDLEKILTTINNNLQ
jgi:hypothetical protein